MKYCPNCGREMQDTDIFCSSCGYSNSTPTPKKENTNATISMILGIISLFIGGLFLSIPAIILAKVSAKETGGEMESQAKVGFICGIVSTVIYSLGIILIAVVYILMLSALIWI